MAQVDMGVITVVISFGALIVSAISLYLSWARFKKERPVVDLAPSLGYYELSGPSPDPTDKASLKVKLEVIVRNLGNSRASVTDFKMLVRYHYSAVTHPMIKDMLNDAHVYSTRPINFSEVVPFDLQEYGSKKVSLTFEFPTLYPRLLDRAIMPIDIRNPKTQDWNDFPIIYQLTASTPSGQITLDSVVFRNDQAESKEVHGSLGWYEEWKMKQKFSPLEHYKNS